jgi:5-carboxymethyl-2-hydroxymuconate isomerase
LPHYVIEHSNNFDNNVDDLLNAVYTGAAASELFNENDIKTRTLSFANYKVGKTKSPFIHIGAKILSGRTDEQKSKLSSSILAEMKKLDFGDYILTIEVIDIHRASHASN